MAKCKALTGSAVKGLNRSYNVDVLQTQYITGYVHGTIMRNNWTSILGSPTYLSADFNFTAILFSIFYLSISSATLIRLLVPWSPKHFKLAMASRWAALSGNTSLIATFSSYYSSKVIANNCPDL